MTNKHMDNGREHNMESGDKLKVAAQGGDVNLLYQLIQEDPHILEHIDSIPFVETPFHVAASAGHLQFAIGIMRLKPSFAWKLNPQGFAPIHLALKVGQNIMVLDLVKINKDLVRVKGRDGFTPLHFASQIGEMDLLTKFFKICPECINDVTDRNETALHIAVKSQRWEALKFLIKWLEMNTDLEETILNWTDEDGNTVLHIAVSNTDIKAIALLTKVSMDLDAKNLAGKTALDIASEDIKKSLDQLKEGRKLCMFIRKINWKISCVKETAIRLFGLKQHISDDERSMYLVVATLVATATYQAALSPPGGLQQSENGPQNNSTRLSNHVDFNFPRGFNFPTSVNSRSNIGNEGNSIMSELDFVWFSLTNMLAFMLSIMATFFLLPRAISSIPLYLTIVLLMGSYYNSMEVISPTPLNTNVVAVIYSLMIVVFLALTYVATAINVSYQVYSRYKISALEKLHTS